MAAFSREASSSGRVETHDRFDSRWIVSQLFVRPFSYAGIKRLGGTYQRGQMPLLGVKMALCQLSTCSDARANPDLGDYGRLFEGRHAPGARLGPNTAAARAADREMLCVGTAMRALPVCPTFLVERDAWITIFLQGPCWALCVIHPPGI